MQVVVILSVLAGLLAGGSGLVLWGAFYFAAESDRTAESLWQEMLYYDPPERGVH
jgi:hypothetical protein